MTAPFLLDEMSEESACLEGRSTYVALYHSITGTSRDANVTETSD